MSSPQQSRAGGMAHSPPDLSMTKLHPANGSGNTHQPGHTGNTGGSNGSDNRGGGDPGVGATGAAPSSTTALNVPGGGGQPNLNIQTSSFLQQPMFTASPLDVTDMGGRQFKGGAPEGADDISPWLTADDGGQPTEFLAQNQGSPANSTEASHYSTMGFDNVELDALSFDDSMAGILDPSAPTSASQQGQAGANIAPWLQEDPAPSPARSASIAQSEPARWDSRRASSPSDETDAVTIADAGSTSSYQEPKKHHHRPHFPRRFRRNHRDAQAEDDAASFHHYSMDSAAASLRSSSASSLLPEGAQTPTSSRPRSVKGTRDVSPPPPIPSRHASVASTGSHGSHGPAAAQNRFSRFGSVATGMSSNPSLPQDKKKGGFLGFIKRKTGQSVSQPPLGPGELPPQARKTTGPSRMSMSTTASSLRKESIGSAYSTNSSHFTSPSGGGRLPSFRSDVGPLEEGDDDEGEEQLHRFELNTNLDDMEGIVDTSRANAPHAQPSIDTTGAGPMGLSDALHHTSGAAATSPSVAPGQAGIPRNVLEGSPGASHFTQANPFAPSGSSSGGGSSSLGTPPSPSNISPKHSLPGGSTAPRRPSQLRNVKIGSVDSENSDVSSMQPIAPSWAQGMTGNPTMFSDPFGAGVVHSQVDGRSPISPSRQGTIAFPNGTGFEGFGGTSFSGGLAPAIPASVGEASEAWAPPESWGVEGDEEEDDTSSSSGTEGDWHDGDRVQTPTGEDGLPDENGDVLASPNKHHRASIWPLKRSQRGAAGQGKFHHDAADKGPPYFTRIYRDDGSYNVMSFPLHTTVGEILSFLAGDSKKVSAAMKLYIRERGQDRQMQPSERPLALQTRRMVQAGFTEHEKLDEIGKEDLTMLCRFIYQTPPLPVMNPEEESSYESFEFIDLSGRDLQVIPIFLHLHADQIIILNVSRNPMTDIPLDFIQACKSLKELRMSNMALKRVPASIRKSTTLSRLDLSCNRIADLQSAHLSEITTLLSLKVQNNRLSSIPSYFIRMTALKYLNISNNNFDEFPTIVCDMSNLVDLDVSFNNIAALPSEMSNLRSLERLICIGNELTEFPTCFSTLANLRVLDIRRNKLVDLTPVYALPNLTTLRADSNNLVTLDTQLGSKVRDFSVPHNSITRFTLAPMPEQVVAYALTHLDLSHGKLSTLDDSALGELVNLLELNLSFNQFTRLPSTLDRCVNLEVLLCTDNMLTSLPKGTLGRMQKLRTCNIHNNNLKEMPEDIWLCGSLEVMNVSSNLLELIPDPPAEWYEKLKTIQAAAAANMNGGGDPARKLSTVSALTTGTTGSDKSHMVPPLGTSLKRLYLGDNQLTDDVFHQIQLFSNLKRLNISFNEIYEVPAYTLRHCQNLERLYLSGNKLTNLPSEDFELLSNLKVLHVNGNKLQTLPSELASLRQLEHLDVGSNVLRYNIANWPYDWNWNWNTALRYLNLSGNKRLEIKPTSGQELSHAAPGHRRDLSDFNALTHLQVLGLMDVTVRIPFLPDESDERRVRTSFSDINNMKYGISDTLGTVEHLSMFDLAVPHFRGSATECIFGMFGRSAPTVPAGKIPRYVQEHLAYTLAEQLGSLSAEEAVTEALRRTFLYMNKAAFDSLAGIEQRHRESTGSMLMATTKSPNLHSQLRTGASGAVVYVVDKTLHIANAGDTLVVLSRKGDAELLGKKHDPTDREETLRIRRAEAWVSPKGFVNDDKEIDISRAFGFYQALPAVNASPEIRTRQLTDTDEFIIIGNSALWKCTSYQTAVDIARTERADPMMAAQKLRDFALSYGAEGSIMVMVVNVSDLFGRTMRSRAPTGGPAQDFDGLFRRPDRRRIEEVGDRTLNRLQQEVEPPTGTVALVFTDIVNSTVLWETNPGMPTAIKMHHNLFRRQLRLDGGYEVKTEGDAFMVSFQSVTAALLWAFNCQIGLLQLEWPRELLESEDGKVVYDSKGNIIHRGLRVRMGIHFGTPECEKDPITRRMDYYGPMVNRAARIQSSADGGQLMASQDVLNVLRSLREYIESSDDHTLDELPDEVKREVSELRRIGGLEVKDVGEKKLKGLEVPEKLSLLLPKTLSGRLELFTGLRANAAVNEQRMYASEKQVEEARALAAIALRLEALCALSKVPHSERERERAAVASPPFGAEAVRSGPQPRRSLSLASSAALIRGGNAPPPNPHLGPLIREHMTEEELVEVLGSLTTRIENCLSSIYLKHLGGFAGILAALEQAGRHDPSLLMHALGLMNAAGAGAHHPARPGTPGAQPIGRPGTPGAQPMGRPATPGPGGIARPGTPSSIVRPGTPGSHAGRPGTPSSIIRPGTPGSTHNSGRPSTPGSRPLAPAPGTATAGAGGMPAPAPLHPPGRKPSIPPASTSATPTP